MRKFRDELSVISVWDTSSIFRTHCGQLTVIPNTSSSSRLSGSLSYKRVHHMFSQILNLRNLKFLYEICSLLWSVLNGSSFKNQNRLEMTNMTVILIKKENLFLEKTIINRKFRIFWKHVMSTYFNESRVNCRNQFPHMAEKEQPDNANWDPRQSQLFFGLTGAAMTSRGCSRGGSILASS